MKRIILFFLNKKINFYLNFGESWREILLITIVLIISVFNGLGFGFIYNQIVADSIKPNIFVPIFSSVYFLLFLLLDFFPSYKKSPYYFPSYYPVNWFKKLGVVLVIQSLNYVSLFILVSVIAFFLASMLSDFLIFLNCILYIYCGFLFNRIFKNLIEYKVKKKRIVLFFSVISVTGLIVSQFQLLFYNYLLLITCTIVLVLIFLLAYTENNKHLSIEVTSLLAIENRYLKLLTNKKISIAILIGIILKMFVLAGSTYTLKYRGEPLYGYEIFQMLFFSPIMVFSYIGLNFFGLNKNLFFSHLLRDSHVKKMLSTYLNSMIFIFLADISISLSFLLINNMGEVENYIFYFTLLTIFTFIGFWFSLMQPVFVQDKFTFNLNINNGLYSDSSGIILLFVLFGTAYLFRYLQEVWLNICLVALLVFFIYRYKFPLERLSKKAYLKSKNI